MFDALSLAEVDRQDVELLPARTVLSLFGMGGGGNCNVGNGSFNGGGLISVANDLVPLVNNDLNNLQVLPIGANKNC
ncbi:MAG TPA: hypothetical protein VE673_19205 [Pseudonocardiaceae bacterium]|nr:hypothetical protein [Pseudonocardiaceae bacterium]